MRLGEAFIDVGLNVKEFGLQNLNNRIGNFLKNAGLLQTAVIGVGAGLSKMTQGVAIQNAELEKFAKNTGLAIEELQRWQEAGQKIDITLSPESITKGIASLQKNLDEIKFGRGDIGAFQVLGIEVGGKDAFQVLEDLRTKIKGLNETEVRSLVTRTGLDQNFVMLLKTSKDKFNELAEQVRLTSEQRGGVIDFGRNTKTLQLNLNALRNQIGANLAPTLSRFFTSLNKFLKENMQPIIAGFKIFTDVIFKFSNVIYNSLKAGLSVLNSVISLFQDLLGKEAGLVAFGLILAKMFLPLNAILKPLNLAIIGIMLLLDDIQTWKMGEDSFLGNFYNWVVKIYDKIIALKNAMFGGEKITAEVSQSKTAGGILQEAGTQALKFGATGAVAGSVIPFVGTGAVAGLSALFGFFESLYSNLPELKNLVYNNPLSQGGIQVPTLASPTNSTVNNITINKNDNSQMNFTTNEKAESIAKEIANAETKGDKEMLQMLKTFQTSTIN